MDKLNKSMSSMMLTLTFELASQMLETPQKFEDQDRKDIAETLRHFAKATSDATLTNLMNEAVRDAPKGKDN